jgi:hypothetical protein
VIGSSAAFSLSGLVSYESSEEDYLSYDGSEDDYIKAPRDRATVAEDAQEVKNNYEDQTLVDYGILDVTKAPYEADPTGEVDSTEALQQASQDASDARMILYLPEGTYNISDHIRHIQGPYKTGGSGWPRFRDHDHPLCIWGDGPEKTTVVLADRAEGYDDPSSPKTMFTLTARAGWGNKLRGNVNFNQQVRGLALDTGSNNPGAIGIDHQGAQISATEDVKIDATGSFAGLRGLCGSGGSTSNIEVVGGQYGLYVGKGWELDHVRGAQPSPVVRKPTLRDQTGRAIYFVGAGPLTLVGADIRGSNIELDGPGWRPQHGRLNLIDSVVETDGSPAIMGDRAAYIYNSFIRGSDELVDLDGTETLEEKPSPWTHIVEYADGPDRYPIYVDGEEVSGSIEDLEHAGYAPDLQQKHEWNRELPNWNDSEVANVKRDYGAQGDQAQTDDYEAIQQAIDENEYVFLPKGIYGISEPLTIDEDTYVFGLGTFTTLTPYGTYLDGGWQSNDAIPGDLPEAYADPDNASPLVETVNDADAESALAFVKLMNRLPGSYSIHWQAGRNSTVRNVEQKLWEYLGTGSLRKHPTYLIDGNGGGEWTNLSIHEGRSANPDEFRHVKVSDTTEPMRVYMYNIEQAESEYQSEFDGAENVNLYGTKTETTPLANVARPPLVMRDCENVGVFGHGSNAKDEDGISLFQFHDCEDIVVTNLSTQVSGFSGSLLEVHEPDGDEVYVDSDVSPLVYTDKEMVFAEPRKRRPDGTAVGRPDK